MRILLDTHIWLDVAADPGKLGRNLRRQLTSPSAELWLSPISVWEALKLAERGRIKTRREPTESIDRALKAFPIREAPVSFEIARETAMFTLPSRDPADIWLAATARVLDLVLATRDRKIIASGVVETLEDG